MSHFGKQRAKKSEQEEKTSYTTYWIHKTSPLTPAVRKDLNREVCVSIDPGTVNYAIRVEERFDTGLVKPLLFVKWNLRGGIPQTPDDYVTKFATLSRHFDEYRNILEQADKVIIERQLAVNYQTTLIMQHTVSYFTSLLMDKPNLPLIYTIHPLVKGKIYGYRKNLDGDLKGWATATAKDVLKKRGDTWSLSVLEKYGKKQDDLSDTVLQAESLYILLDSPFRSVIGAVIQHIDILI